MEPTLPILDTARLRLVPWESGNLEPLHQLWIDPGVRRFLWDDRIATLEEARDLIERSLVDCRRTGLGHWTLRLRNREPIIGFAGLRPTDVAGEADLVYGLDPAYWRRGLATEAARAVLAYGFERLCLTRIVANTDPPNQASIRVLERLGMRFERRAVVDGHDLSFYAVDCDDRLPPSG